LDLFQLYMHMVLFLAFDRYQQNHHQKVFSCETALVQWD